MSQPLRLLRMFFVVAMLLPLGIAACNGSKNPSKPTDEFSNELTLGTGMSGFDLIGETTSFPAAPALIFYRLESAADLGGSAIEIRVEKKVNGAYLAAHAFPYSNPQNYGHIFLSSFTLTETGEYRATGSGSPRVRPLRRGNSWCGSDCGRTAVGGVGRTAFGWPRPRHRPGFIPLFHAPSSSRS